MIDLGRNIMIVGCSGGGKSTLARALGEKLGLRVIHNDTLFWKEGWVERDKDETVELVRQAIAADGWIHDGNFSRTHRLRVAKADSLIWIDLPRLACIWNVLKRVAKNYGRTRPDLADGCPEKFDWDFLVYIWTFKNNGRHKIEKLFAETDGKLQRFHLQSRREIRTFLDSVKSAAPGEP